MQAHRKFLTRSFIRKAQQKGYRVIAWDVHSEELMQKFISFGVDGFETDYPDRLLKVISGMQGSATQQ